MKCSCGKPATKGSMQDPYCQSCWDRLWGDDYEAFAAWLNNLMQYTEVSPLEFRKKILARDCGIPSEYYDALSRLAKAGTSINVFVDVKRKW